jgi:leader peptidase (prepilin peptidase)/N-methyltransferase
MLMPIVTHLPPLVIQAVFFIALLIIASAIDVRKRIIPNSICALIALTGLIYFSPVKLFGLLTALPLLIPALYKQNSIGGGDIKLSAAVGFVLGFEGGIAGLTIGLTTMLVFYFGITATRWLQKGNASRASKTALPMAPFLSIGFITIYILSYFVSD